MSGARAAESGRRPGQELVVTVPRVAVSTTGVWPVVPPYSALRRGVARAPECICDRSGGLMARAPRYEPLSSYCATICSGRTTVLLSSMLSRTAWLPSATDRR